MKKTKKNKPYLILFIVLGIVIGTLLWAIIERILALQGMQLSLSVGPIGVDLYAFSVSIRANPGSFLGVFIGIFMFRTL